MIAILTTYLVQDQYLDRLLSILSGKQDDIFVNSSNSFPSTGVVGTYFYHIIYQSAGIWSMQTVENVCTGVCLWIFISKQYLRYIVEAADGFNMNVTNLILHTHLRTSWTITSVTQIRHRNGLFIAFHCCDNSLVWQSSSRHAFCLGLDTVLASKSRHYTCGVLCHWSWFCPDLDGKWARFALMVCCLKTLGH